MGAQKRQKKRLFELAAQQQRGFQGISKCFCELLFQRREYGTLSRMDTIASILAAIAVSANETIASQNVTNNEGIQFAIRLSECLHCSSCAPYSSCVQLQRSEIFQSSKAHKERFKIDDCTR